MKIEVGKEFIKICETIKAENKSEAEWALIESDDMFQSENYEGGFDDTEMEFCFSYHNAEQEEYWFQLSLIEVIHIAMGTKNTIEIRKPAEG